MRDDPLHERYGRFDPAWLAGWPVESIVIPRDFAERTHRGSIVDSPTFRVLPEGERWRPASDWMSEPRRSKAVRVPISVVKVEAVPRVEVLAADVPEDLRRPIYSDAHRKMIDLAVRAGMPWDSIVKLVGVDTVIDGEAPEVVTEINGLRAHHSTGRAVEVPSYPLGGGVGELRRWRFERGAAGRFFVRCPAALV